ncbi:hypothetical protein GQ44DRAFT_821683 [Phaeosphaeriaceae sp. PMI808]|nr:hypothetical protein GQ44DRAFT_821683 [Phaeosphaeriaceae sp. PMI808]
MAAQGEPLGCVLVTGGCGFQGHHLIKQILDVEPNCKVYALDINTDRPLRRHAAATYLTCDIGDTAAVNAAFDKMQPPPRVVYHTTCPPSMNLDPDIHWRVNVDGTRNMLAAADRVGSVHALVLTSTVSAAYDGVAELIEVDELPIINASRQSPLQGRLRGPVIKNGQAKYRFGNGKNLFDFIYVGNACHAHILAARKLLAAHNKSPLPETERVEGEVASNLLGYPLSHNEIVSIPKYVGLAIAYITEWVVWLISFGKRTPKMSVAAVQYTFLAHTMNTDKAKKRLQYTPQCSLQEGLERTVDWCKKNDKKE